MDTGNANIYRVMVRATETTAVGDGPNMADELEVTVQVMNSDEPGMVEPKWLQPEVNTPLPATLIDPDGNSGDMLPIAMDTVITTANWQWYRAKNSNPNRNPNVDMLGEAISDWETLDGQGNPTSDDHLHSPREDRGCGRCAGNGRCSGRNLAPAGQGGVYGQSGQRQDSDWDYGPPGEGGRAR